MKAWIHSTQSPAPVRMFIIIAQCNNSVYRGMKAEIQLPLKRSSRFQRLFPNPSWLVWGRGSRHQKLAPTFPGIDSCLMVTKRDFLEMEASLTEREVPKCLLGVDCLFNAVGKLASIPLIYLGRKWTLNWWWRWWWLSSHLNVKTNPAIFSHIGSRLEAIWT